MINHWELLPSQKFFWKSLKFKISHCKNFQCPLTKISLHYQTPIDQKLTVFHQLFSETSVGPSKCPIDKMIDLQGHVEVWAISWIPCVLKSLKIKIRHCKNFQYPLSKISLHYQNIIDQRLTVFHHGFSWTSIGSSKFPINKMIGSQGHLRVWAIPSMPYVLSENSFFHKNIFESH